jgi:long-chain acyl-CoA synthetase
VRSRGLYIFNIVTFLQQMDTEPLFKVIYVPPEIKERALEPMTSIEEQSGTRPTLEAFRDALAEIVRTRMGVTLEEGSLTRDEILAYEKNRTLAARVN